MEEKNGNNTGDEGAVKRLVREMVERKGIPEVEKEAEEKRILGLLEEMVQDEIVAALPTEALEELNDLLDGEDFSEERLEEILSQSQVTPEEAAKKVLEEFYREYLGLDMEEEK
ncbi:hypothetical protein IJI72_02545 [Candidatus Saccharibacteria bacterium]|nr:hypothetical protein [Candidatus Saccharibacteria bacterium]